MVVFDEDRYYRIESDPLPSYSDEEIFELREFPGKILEIPEGIKSVGNLGKKIRKYDFRNSNFTILIPSKGVEEVVFPSSVECIETNAFASTEIKKLKLNEGLKYIKLSAFNHYINSCYENTHLEELEIPDSVEYLGRGCFADMHTLKKVTLGKKIEIITNDVFYGCENLEEIEIPEGVQVIGKRAFQGCKKLKHIKLPESIRWIGKDAFKDTGINCDELNLPFMKNGFAFRGDGIAEYYYGSETEVTVPSFIKRIGTNCFTETNVKKVILGENVIEIKGHAFEKCRNLESVVINKNIKNIPNKCFFLSTLKKIEGDLSGLKCVANHAFAISKIESFDFPEGFEVVGVSAFSSCKNLKEITFESGFEEIRNGAFYNCKNLKTVVSPSFDLKKISATAFTYYIQGIEFSDINSIENQGPHFLTFNYKTCADGTAVEYGKDQLKAADLEIDKENEHHNQGESGGVTLQYLYGKCFF